MVYKRSFELKTRPKNAVLISELPFCITRLIWNFGSWNQNISNYNTVKQGDHDGEHAVRAVPIDLASNIKS